MSGFAVCSCVATLQRMAGKRKGLYSSRFLAVINRHALPRHMVRCVLFPAVGKSVFPLATRIGHIGVAAEGLTTGAFNRPIRNVQAAASQSCDGQADFFGAPGQRMDWDLR
ncbi:hypothetical protein [Rhizobium laguerreae]|uniref:hypothetical protein n=1 Tax=Rhizobium laguerreae TaxID=1076926 RepID=UPI001C9249C2|nr:hypothetical protein [Rhizobium laguerreae]MBY3486684.1 hypothetical protein [Rhizobium laguerreae]